MASPTLAQGLNLSASVVLFHGIRRGKPLLTGSEFSNVIGRAGRAFVDTEGLVLCPFFEPSQWRRAEWLRLTRGETGKALRSGLIEVSKALIRRIEASIGSNDMYDVLEYLTGGPQWTLPVVAGESSDQLQVETLRWRSGLALLDAGILGVVGEDGSDPDEITQLIADALKGSLWERQIRRLELEDAAVLREMVTSRTSHIWRTSTAAQRRGWYLAGLGADAGGQLAQVSSDVLVLLAAAETAIADRDYSVATSHLEQIAETIFSLPSFRPDTKIDNWREVLGHWMNGEAVIELNLDGPDDRVAVAQFIESDLIYRLVWGMEAARVYEVAQGNDIAELLDGSAVAAVETGTYLRAASTLIRAGFDHRSAAIAAVVSTDATFTSVDAMTAWIAELEEDVSDAPDWPTSDSHRAWLEFARGDGGPRRGRWRLRSVKDIKVTWFGEAPPPGTRLRVLDRDDDRADLWSAGFDLLGSIAVRLNPKRVGVLHARTSADDEGIELRYRGPDDFLVAED